MVLWLAGLVFALVPVSMAHAEVPACGAEVYVGTATRGPLASFARQVGLAEIDAFVGTVATLRSTGRLPDCYLPKSEAEDRGWAPGEDLWRVAPGAAIGGDRFGNRERRLPAGGRYREADLDYVGGHRGQCRLVYAESPLGVRAIWVTLDHYETFRRVPLP